MNSVLNVKVENDKTNADEYVIKDIHNILLGRFKVMEMDEIKRRCNINLFYYKENDYSLLKDALKSILKAVFKNNNIFKVNIKIKDNLEIASFLDLGFMLEGILCENEFSAGDYNDELMLGITKYDYEKSDRYSNIHLEGNHIVIKNFTPDMAGQLLEYYKNNKIHLAPFEPDRDEEFFTIETQRKNLLESYRQFLNGTNIDMGIFFDEKLIGKVKISNIVYGSFRSGIVGYSLDKDFCGKGYMKEALHLVLKYAFEECDLHRIEASALVTNEKSRNVLRRCGFKLIGINEKYLLINGRWQDHASYYIVKEDFYKS